MAIYKTKIPNINSACFSLFCYGLGTDEGHSYHSLFLHWRVSDHTILLVAVRLVELRMIWVDIAGKRSYELIS